MAASSSREDIETLAKMEEGAAHDHEHNTEDIKMANTAEQWNQEEESIDKCMDPEIYEHAANLSDPNYTKPESSVRGRSERESLQVRKG
ncbi:hypothetical protein ACFX15_009988 [Malus domestica]